MELRSGAALGLFGVFPRLPQPLLDPTQQVKTIFRKVGHLEQGTGKTQHSAAIAKVNAETLKANAKREAAGEKPLLLPLPAFEPYTMRHTALTRMAPLCDAFTLARIAGHSSITITQRYCHPQADAVEATSTRFSNRDITGGSGLGEMQLPSPRPEVPSSVPVGA